MAAVDVTSVRLSEGRTAEVLRHGRPGGRATLFFHSPATAGEELDGAAEEAADQLGIELLTIVRRSLAGDGADERFMAAVATDAHLVVAALGLEPLVVLGWSGGAPYALAATDQLGPMVSAVHLVSPLPGPLTGPDALPHQSPRLRQIAETAPTSSWAAAPGTLRDYRALAAPWPFEVRSVVQPVTIWSPTADEIVPPRLIDHLARQLPHVEVVGVAGSHDWMRENWATVLRRITIR